MYTILHNAPKSEERNNTLRETVGMSQQTLNNSGSINGSSAHDESINLDVDALINEIIANYEDNNTIVGTTIISLDHYEPEKSLNSSSSINTSGSQSIKVRDNNKNFLDINDKYRVLRSALLEPRGSAPIFVSSVEETHPILKSMLLAPKPSAPILRDKLTIAPVNEEKLIQIENWKYTNENIKPIDVDAHPILKGILQFSNPHLI